MTWQIPTWYGTILLALAAWRTFLLLAEDKVLDRPRDRVAPAGSKRTEFIACAACFGAWVALGWWLAWIWQPHWTLVVAAVFAVSALLILVEDLHGD